jgi:DinB superfamily
MDIFLEIGKNRTFATALDWPGWSRSGKDEAAALQALLDYGPRYAQAIQGTRLEFQPPESTTAFNLLERLQGNASTDFGAPHAVPSADHQPVSPAELQRFQALLESMWEAFEAVAKAAEGKELRYGPRGGGRDLQKIVQHVLEAEQAYLKQLGGKLDPSDKSDHPFAELDRLHQAILVTLEASARGELPTVGPRGGKRWGPRFFVRYTAWHLLDHLWEIEDRLV